MKLYPGATYSPTTNAANQKAMTVHDYVCTHTMVSSFVGVDTTWHASGYSGSFAHFMVRGDGFVKQTQDLDRRAAANLDGNFNVISIENADKGETFPAWTGSDVPNFTEAQLAANVALLDWLCAEYDIPRTLVPNTVPGTRGIAYHRQGISGNYVPYDGIVAGGVRWSNATGKACPGDRRVAQLKTVIIPALQGESVQLNTALYDETQVIAAAVGRPDLVAAIWPAGTTGPGTALVTVNEERFHTLMVLAAKAGLEQPVPAPAPGGTPNFAEIAANLHLEANG